MAITVKFYNFAKKVNSTKQLVLTGPGADVPVYSTDRCLIKSGSQIVTPDLEIALPANTNISAWNYVYIPDFNRFYFINDATYDNGQWVFHLGCDVLATYKDRIGESEQYVTRSASSYDLNIIDTLYPVKPDLDSYEIDFGTALTTGYGGDSTNCHYVVGIINNDLSAQIGGVSYYAMTIAQMGALKNLLLTDNNWIGNVDPGATTYEISQSKVDINPYQYIVSCKFFPTPVGHDPTITNNIHIGWWQSSVSGYAVSRIPYSYNAEYNFLHHPQSDTRGAYLNSKAYTSYAVDFCGMHIDLDPDQMMRATKITLGMYADYVSGNAYLEIYGRNPSVLDPVLTRLAALNFMLAIDIPLSQITYTNSGLSNAPSVCGIPIGAVTSALDGLGKSVYGFLRERIPRVFNPNKGVTNTALEKAENAFKSGMTSWANNIGTCLGWNGIVGSYSGSPGSLAGVYQNGGKPSFKYGFRLIADENLADYGRPLCQRVTLNTLNGYIKCGGAEVAISGATEREQEEIIAQLNGGFYYE